MGEGPRLHTQLMESFLETGHSPTVVMGLAKGTRPQDLAEKRRKEMQGRNGQELLEVMLPGVRGKSLNSGVILPKEYTGTRGHWKVGRQEEGWSDQRLSEGHIPSPTGSSFEAI